MIDEGCVRSCAEHEAGCLLPTSVNITAGCDAQELLGCAHQGKQHVKSAANMKFNCLNCSYN